MNFFLGIACNIEAAKKSYCHLDFHDSSSDLITNQIFIMFILFVKCIVFVFCIYLAEKQLFSVKSTLNLNDLQQPLIEEIKEIG